MLKIHQLDKALPRPAKSPFSLPDPPGALAWLMKSTYDPEHRAEIRQRMSPPSRESVAEIARSTGVNA